jgi:ABC-type thiamine transport system ATPase subunit
MLGSLHLHIDAELPQGHYNFQHTLKLDDGDIGVYGDSGQGKTTLLKIIAGLIEVNPNALTWSNSAYQSLSPEQNCVVYQAQTPYLFAHLTVIQNLQLVLKHA